MKKSFFLLCFLLLSQLLYSQQSISVDEVPPSVFGDYLNSSGHWSMDINKDFVIENRFLPYGYFKDISREDDVYTFSVKSINPSQSDYDFKLKLGGADTIFIAVQSSNWEFMPFTRIPPSGVEYPDNSQAIKDFKGKWYLTDGSNKLFVDFSDEHCELDGKEFTYGRYIIHGNTRQLNISGKEFGSYVHFVLPDRYTSYTRIEVLGKGWIGLKRSPELPNHPSILYSEIPEKFKGTMYGTHADNFSLKLLPDYHIQFNDNVIKLDQLTENNNVFTVQFSQGARKLEYSVSPVNENYSKLHLSDNEYVYLKHKKNLPDGISVENEFVNQWSACNGSNTTLHIEKNKIRTEKGEGPNAKITNLLFDGQHYKLTKGKNIVAYLKKINQEYVEVSTQLNGRFIQFKKYAELPDEAEIELPLNIQANWSKGEDGEWVIGLMPEKLLFRNDFWNYDRISYSNGTYKINASKTDTVCFKNEAGKEVCKLFPKKVALGIRHDNSNTIMATVDGRDEIKLVNYATRTISKPDFDIPVHAKAGYAVLKGYVHNLPKKHKNARFEVYVNDMFYGRQVTYSGKPDESGFFTISVPLVTPQDVYMRAPGSFSTNFLIPGDTLLLFVDGSKLNDPANWLWMGRAAGINHELLSLNSSDFRAVRSKWNETDRKNVELEPEEYKASRKLILEEQLKYHKMLSKNGNHSIGFLKWLASDMAVSYFEDLLRYCWLRNAYNKSREVLTEHPTYFDFVDSLAVTDRTNWSSGHLSGFVSELEYHSRRKAGNIKVSTDSLFWREVLKSDSNLTKKERKTIQSIISLMDDPEEQKTSRRWQEVLNKNYGAIGSEIQKRELKKVDAEDLLDIIMDIDKTISRGEYERMKKQQKAALEREVFLTDVRSRNAEMARELSEREFLNGRLKQADNMLYKSFFRTAILSHNLYEKIESNDAVGVNVAWHNVVASNEVNDDIKAHLELAYNKALEDLAKPLPEFASLNNVEEGSADEFLKNLALKHPGKVLYIDFWAPWCGPCRGEFEYAPAMKEATKEKDVEYIYICGSGEKQAWENCIKKYNLEGDHYYVAQDTYSDLSGKFGINGIPRYMIMNKKGQMVNENAPRPSNLTNTIKELEKHLQD